MTGLLHYNVRQFITSLNGLGVITSKIWITHEIHEHETPTNNNHSVVVCVRFYGARRKTEEL